MQLNFIKMQASGNDYVYFDTRINSFPCLDASHFCEFVRKVSDRHFGIGGDGVVMIFLPESAENNAKMRIFNADGSEGMMCGNALRSLGAYLLLSEKNPILSKEYRIETASGVRTVFSNRNSVEVLQTAYSSVNMSFPSFLSISPDFDISLLSLFDIYLGNNISISSIPKLLSYDFVSVGNPHLVLIFDDELPTDFAEFLGHEINNSVYFSGGVNVDFSYIPEANAVAVLTYERGSELTLSCGSGACASAFSALNHNFVKESRIRIFQQGGNVEISLADNGEFILSGDAEIVFTGSFVYSFT